METNNSLQQSEYYGELRYLQQRNKEELLHKDWMRQRKDLENKFQKKMKRSMKVRSSDNRVKFTYKYKGHKVLGATIFRFKRKCNAERNNFLIVFCDRWQDSIFGTRLST